MPKQKINPRSDWRQADPAISREAAKYGEAIPSREYIIQYLEERGVPLTFPDLCDELGLETWEAQALRKRLRAMERDGQLICNRREGYGVVRKMDLVTGRVIGHADGHGFLVPDDGSDNLFISPRHMRELMHGDRAVMRIANVDYRGRREGALVEVLERNTQRVVGRLIKERGIYLVVPDNKRISHDVLISPEDSNGAKAGQIVIADLVEQPSKHHQPMGRVVEILGDHMAPGMEVDIAIASHNIPHQWPPEVIRQARGFGPEVPEEAKAGRLDLRKLPLVTIDGETARDFDDAVFCEPRGQNWRLVVAIADVAHYVSDGSPLDVEAKHRGTSVYFPDRVIPMLPEALSNGLCSLNPEVDRLCMVCEMTISPGGKILRSKFSRGVMCSHARLTYTLVAEIVVERDPKSRQQYAQLTPHLDNLYALYQVLKEAREQRGAMDFDTQETQIIYGLERKIERIVPTSRNDAHRLIEECMISANVAAARFLIRHKMPALYRIHEGPSSDRLENLRAFLGELGLGLGGGLKPTAQDYGRLMARCKDRPDAHLIQTMLLRSMTQAVYSPKNIGHFGLALEGYAHFTSPIRRYPDLLVHRAINHILTGGKASDYGYTFEEMVTLGDHTSMTERRADDATRDAVEWLKCEYMSDKVGEVFDAVVTSVTGFGLFVQLTEVFVDGLVHVTALPNDYYHFDPVGQRLQGERTNKTFRLGDTLKVKLVRVDLDERKIDFEPAGAAARGGQNGGGGPRRGARKRRK